MSEQRRGARPGNHRPKSSDQEIKRVSGWNPVLGLLRHSPERVRVLELDEANGSPRAEEARALAKKNHVPVQPLPLPKEPRPEAGGGWVRARDRDRSMGEGPGERMESVAARIAPWRPGDFDEWRAGLDLARGPLVLALDQITDQGNLGAILRSAEFFGVAGVLLPQDRSAMPNATTLRASQGALLFLDVLPVTNLARALDELKEDGFWIVGSALEGRNHFSDVDPSLPRVLCLGAEDKGLRRLTRERCDYLVRVHGRGLTESLNVSAFAALALHRLSES
jgi:23S rRNA (guanosine2251-2'-O)-methyltransferase